jgi:adenine-specific DNA-methyltransferase
MLAAAMSKQEGFMYHPDQSTYWKQGSSTENDFIFTTTLFLTANRLKEISDSLNADQSLLICCTQFEAGLENKFSNINIKKIPSMLLGKCEFGKDDYSLNIIDLPDDESFEKLPVSENVMSTPSGLTPIDNIKSDIDE